MRELPLTRGRVALIDDEDFERASEHKWFARPSGRDRYYAARRDRKAGKVIRLHRFILGAQDDQIVDHIDGDGLNNQRANLRFCNRAENAWNTGRRLGRPLPKGVCAPAQLSSSARPFIAKIVANAKQHYLGTFSDPIEAGLAYDSAAIRLHGAFARLNFPEISSQPTALFHFSGS